MKKTYQKLSLAPLDIKVEAGIMLESVKTMKAKVTVESYEDHQAFSEDGPLGSAFGNISFGD